MEDKYVLSEATVCCDQAEASGEEAGQGKSAVQQVSGYSDPHRSSRLRENVSPAMGDEELERSGYGG